MLTLLVGMALAADPEGIVPLPAGTVVTLPQQPSFTLTGQSYLLPEFHYDTALTKARKLDIFEPAFQECTVLASQMMKTAADAFTVCKTQFGDDAALVEKLRADVASIEVRAVSAESKLQVVRGQRNIAWAITGGLVLGAITITAVAVGG